MSSHLRSRMSRPALPVHGSRSYSVLSSNTSASNYGPEKYLYMSTARTDLTQCELYKTARELLPGRSNDARLSKLNQSDCFYPNNQKTKSEFQLSRSELQQNMYVLPLNQNNVPGYHSSPSSAEYSEHVYHQQARGHVQYHQHKYEGFRPVQTKYFRSELSGYQVSSSSSHLV